MSRPLSFGSRSRLAVVGILLGSALVWAEADRLTSRPQTPVEEQAVEVGTEIRTDAGQRRRLVLPDGSILYVNEHSSVKLAAKQRLVLTTGEIFVEAADSETPLSVQAPKRAISGRAARFGVRVSDDGSGVIATGGQVTVGDVSLRAGQQLLPGSDRPTPAPRAAHQLEWARDLMAAAETPLVPKSVHAGGALVAIDPGGQEMKLSLRKYHVDVHVEDGFARTTIDQIYFNHEAQRLEGTFYFPLPADASLCRLAMYVDGILTEGGMVERDYGRNVYEEIKYRMKDPALLEWVDGSTFKLRVFPLEPRQEKRIVLSYSQRLPAQHGRLTYRFPAGHSLGVVQDWSFHAFVKAGAGLAWNAAGHPLKGRTEGADLLLDGTAKQAKLDRDLVVTLEEKEADAPGDAERARFSSAELDGSKYLMLRYRPSLPGQAQRQRRDWVFLFESSGDRDPLLARVQIDVVRNLLGNAGPDDTFAILAAGTRVHALSRTSQPVTPANVKAAVAFLENVHLIGALDVEKALGEATPMIKAGKDPHLIHVGSGIATLGEQRTDKLVAAIPQGTRYVGIGVGRRWGRNFMKAAAEKTGGVFTQINPDEPVSWRSFELAASLDAPRLLDIRVTDKAGKTAFLSETSAIAQGEEVCAMLRVGAELPEAVTISGTVGGRSFERTLLVKDVRPNAGYVPRTWAKLEIDRLLVEDAVKHKEQIIALSKALYVMSPFTSLLVLENEEMFVRYKVDRGRKDHWALYPCPDKVPVVYEPLPGMPADVRSLAKEQKPNKQQVLNTIVATAGPVVHGQIGGATLDYDVPREDRVSPPRLYHDRPEKGGLFFASEFISGALGLAQPVPVGVRPSSSGGANSSTGANLFGSSVRSQAGLTGSIVQRPQSRVGQIFVAGNTITSNNVILRQVPTYPGQILNQPDLQIAESNLRNLNVFENPYPNSGRRRMGELLNESEDLRSVGSTTRLTVSQIHGGITSSPAILAPISLQGLPTSNDLAPSTDDRPFFDLVSYCPGMRSTWADLQTVVDAEAAPDVNSIPGRIDAGARKLIDRARLSGWQALTLPAEDNQPALTMTFDGTGRYAWERTLPPGLRERVVCDGQTILHLYPELGIGARRIVGVAHRLDLSSSVPWFVPPVDDLAHGGDLELLDERTVAIVPKGVDEEKDGDGKPLSYARLHLLFNADGTLAERRLVEMPAGKVLERQLLAADGTVKLLDADAKEIAVRKWKLAAAAAPDLTPSVKGLVVLPLPYRTIQHVDELVRKEQKEGVPLSQRLALLQFAAEFGRGSADSAQRVFKDRFFNREQRDIGFYVLLAACGANLDAEHVDILATHPNEPLAQYLALYSSPVLRKHASQWAVGIGQWKEGFLQDLAVTHALLQRWQNGKLLVAGDAIRRAEIDKALAYVRKNKGSAFSWSLLTLMQERAQEEEAAKRASRDLRQALAEAFATCADVKALNYAARYEEARNLFKAGQTAAARKKFRTLYEETFKKELLPPIDADFRLALLGEKDEWGDLVRRTGAQLIADKHRPAALALARQCWQLGDEALAHHLLDAVLDKVDDKHHFGMTLAGIRFLMEAGQFVRADQLLDGLLAEPKHAGKAVLWRLGVELAEHRDLKARRLECLERALDAEYRNLPEVIDVSAIRSDYEKLLGHYEALSEAMVTLKVAPPADFHARVVRAADRWRALDTDGSKASQAAARIFRLLGDRELSWDYATTPIGLSPGESGPWVNMAQTLSRQGELDLADRAFAAAFAAEPTDAQILWERSQNLTRAGKRTEADKLVRQLADGTWQPRFQALQEQARWQLKK